MAAPAYVSLEEFKNYAGGIMAADTAEDEVADVVILAASRAIDGFTRRRFYLDEEASARQYRPTNCVTTWVADIGDREAVTVEIDSAGDGTYATEWDAADFLLEPLNGVTQGIEGWPATRIVALGRQWPQARSPRPLVQVTAKWGWAEIPTPIVDCCLMTALDLFKMKDAPFGFHGFGDYGPLRVRANAKVAELLDGVYCRAGGFA